MTEILSAKNGGWESISCGKNGTWKGESWARNCEQVCLPGAVAEVTVKAGVIERAMSIRL